MAITGFKELERNLKEFKNTAEQVLIKGVFYGCVLIQNEAKLNHGAGAHGKGRYENRTTNLTNSIQATPPKVTANMIKGEVIVGMDYAEKVELGSAKSRPYPFLFPALEKMSAPIKKGLQDILKAIKWVN